MENNGFKTENKYKTYILSLVIGILITAALIGIFGVIMYLLELDKNLSPVLATVSLGFGTFAAAFVIGKKLKKRGILIGFLTGVTAFLLVTVISLAVDKGGITVNTLFHFIILLLSGLIGGISGVNNNKSRKYI